MSLRPQLVLALALVVGCAGGAEHGNVFGNSIGSAHGDDGAATKGGATMPASDDGSSDDGASEDESSSTGDEPEPDATSSGGEPPAPVESSSDEGESSGIPDVDDDGGDVGDPMYAPCDPNGSDCADGFCLLIQDQDENVLGSFCTGPCALPDQDCDLPSTGNAEPACLVSEEGPSICTLDCGDSQACPDGMQCLEFPGVQLRCV